MDEKQLLNEIAYYSRYINEYNNKSFSYTNNKVFIKPHINTNKFKYVKNPTSNASTSAVIKPVQKTSNKVLINPNFKQPNVYINPHFNAANSARKILVNPKILNKQFNINTSKLTEPLNINPVLNNINDIPKTSNHIPTSLTVRKRRLSIRSQYKIVKSSVLNKDQNTDNPIKQNTNKEIHISTRKRRLSIRSKYKIVKSSSINPLKSTVITPRKRRTSIRSKYKIVKSSTDINKNLNKYKIDRRSIATRNKSICKKKVLTNGISDILRKNLFKNNSWKSKRVINQFKSNNTRLTNISGILYKKTQTKLQKIQPNQKTIKLKRSINLKETKIISTTNKILKRSILKQRISNKFSTSISSIQHSGRKKIQRNKLKKNNIPCPVYRRYGKCRRKESGRCVFLHDSNQIFLCKKFLQGACLDKDCLLSHKVSLEKMPTCKYFLEGCCTKNDCPYLHVKINPKSDICRKFLQGFCDKGSQCNLRHQFLCPDFERTGKCPKRKCIYPHKTKCDKESVKIKEILNQRIEVVKQVDETESAQTDSARYYIDKKSDDDGDNFKQQVIYFSNNEIVDELINDDKKIKRPQLGELPSFIPFE